MRPTPPPRYRALSGKFPFGDSATDRCDITAAVLRDEFVDPRYAGSASAAASYGMLSISDEMVAVLSKALKKSPCNRFESASSMALQLEYGESLISKSRWQSVNKEGRDKTKLFEVMSGTDEFGSISAKFHATLPTRDYRIEQLDRIENGWVHAAYRLQVAAIQQRLDGGERGTFDRKTMIRTVFHGTSAVDDIVNAADGHSFLPLLSGTNVGAIWGHGTYFARDASYSNNYANMLTSGQQQLLLVEIVTGNVAQGRQGMKVYPEKCSSLVNSVAEPSIFVIQHTNQACPAYLITYRNFDE